MALGRYFLVSSSKFKVPLALTEKSVCGSLAAQSCDGCAAAWIINSNGISLKTASNSEKSRISRSKALKLVECNLLNLFVFQFIEASLPKKNSRRLLSMPITSNPLLHR